MPWVVELPADPHDYKIGAGATFWIAAFPDGPPISPQIDMRSWLVLDGSFKARGLTPIGTSTQIATVGSSSSSGELGTVQAMGNMMLQGMQQMASQQQKMMEFMMSGGRSTPGLRQLLDSTSPRVHSRPSAGSSPLPLDNLVLLEPVKEENYSLS